jgi:DNA polymerase-3 subunit delta
LPTISQAEVTRQLESGTLAPLYLIVGSDEAAKIKLAGSFLDLIDEGLRAFNSDRLYGGEAKPIEVIEAARTLPMMAPRRIVLLVHADRLLYPKKESEESERALAAFEAYVSSPVDTCTLVLVADTLDGRRKITKLLLSKASVVDCSGPSEPNAIAKWVRDRVAEAGLAIDARAARLVAERIGPDISRLRSDVQRLVLYAADKKSITEDDVKELIAAATSDDDWGVTNAIERRDAGRALRELGAMIDNGGVPQMILGQLAWFVRTKVPPQKVDAAVEAVFRTDLAMKTSAGDPRVLLERLVVELCG